MTSNFKRKSVTPEQREKYLMALAMDISEKRMQDGTASSSEIIWWLQRSSPKAQLELENLRLQNDLLRARRDSIVSTLEGNKDYAKAMKAFSGYLPTQDDNIIDGEFDEVQL